MDIEDLAARVAELEASLNARITFEIKTKRKITDLEKAVVKLNRLANDLQADVQRARRRA